VDVLHLARGRSERHRGRGHDELLATQERLREAHEVARLSSWEWLPESDQVVVFQALPAADGLSGSRPLDELLEAMSPHDRRIARQDLDEMAAGRREESTRRCCYELPDGKAWLETRSRALRDPAGRLTSVRGTTQEVTEQQLATHELSRARNYLRAVADGMGEGLCTSDPEGRIVYMNRAALTLLGWTDHDPEGRDMHGLLHPGCSAAADLPRQCALLRAAGEGITARVEDGHFSRRDGSSLAVAYTAAPFVTDDGIEGSAVVFADTTERKAREASMERDVETLSWIRRIKAGLSEDRFELFAQPIMDLRSGKVVQRELLLRLREPDGRIIAPHAYLPIAEQYGLVGEIDRWVIGRCCEISAVLGAVHLNVSACSLEDTAIVDWIELCLERTGADPSLLVFEITETALIADQLLAETFAVRLHGLGCKLALDDFGTGYGGFTYLKQLPVDMLKIDSEFVRDLSSSAASRHVVVAVVALAHAFDLQTVAEGVEDARTLDTVRELGVDMAQGFHIARPAPIGPVTAKPKHRSVSAETTGLPSQVNG
jgi:PAS domain S-box-containing protein